MLIKTNVLGRVQMSHAHKRIVIPLFQCFKNTSESKTSTVGCELQFVNVYVNVIFYYSTKRIKYLRCFTLRRSKPKATYTLLYTDENQEQKDVL
jgi:hypothetical protein